MFKFKVTLTLSDGGKYVFTTFANDGLALFRTMKAVVNPGVGVSVEVVP